MRRRTVAAVVLAAGLVGLASGSASGAPVLRGGAAPRARTEVIVPSGQIALVRGRPSEIWLERPDGSDARQLTDLPGSAQPSWSPDATAIAFAAPGDGGTDVWTIASDDPSAQAVQVTHGMHAEHPAWSPHREWIAFDSTIDGAIWLVHPDGSGRKRLTSAHVDREPAWSLDGSQVAFARSVGGSPSVAHQVSVADDTVHRENTNTFVSDPTFTGEGELVLVLGHGTKRRIIQGNGAVPITSLRPSWNPMLVRGANELAYLATTNAGTSLVIANLPDPRTGEPGPAHVLIPSVVGTNLTWEPATGPCLSHDVPGRITCAHALRIARRAMGGAPGPPVATWAWFTSKHRGWFVREEGYTSPIDTPFPEKYPCWSGTQFVVMGSKTGRIDIEGWAVWNVPCPSG
jgi:hypothetical protein